MKTIWQERFALLLNLFIVSLFGMAFFFIRFIGTEFDTSWKTALFVIGLLLVMPWLFYGHAVCIWHWKARYRGKHSDLWGVVLILETSGWFRLIYMLRHILPDARQSGRYAGAEYKELKVSNMGLI